jgi:Protein of unknown function (DUF732)
VCPKLSGGRISPGTSPEKLTIQLLISCFFPALSILHLRADLNPHTDGIVNAKKKGSAQMPSPRWLARLTIPIVAGAALVTSAPIATADPADDAYLSQLRGMGFTWPPEHDEAITAVGRLICDDLMSGWTYDQIAQNIHATLDPRNVGFGDVRSAVSLAHTIYCPAWRCWGTQC